MKQQEKLIAPAFYAALAVVALPILLFPLSAASQQSTFTARNALECKETCVTQTVKKCLMAYHHVTGKKAGMCEITLDKEPDVMKTGSYRIFAAVLHKWLKPKDVAKTWPHLSDKMADAAARRMAATIAKKEKDQSKYCRRHANSSSNQQRTNYNEKCGKSGWGWTEVVKSHFDWCMSLPKEVFVLKAEQAFRDRYAALRKCTEIAK